MFLPQVVPAITAAALSPVGRRRWSLQRVLQAGLTANLLAMLLLVASQTVADVRCRVPDPAVRDRGPGVRVRLDGPGA